MKTLTTPTSSLSPLELWTYRKEGWFPLYYENDGGVFARFVRRVVYLYFDYDKKEREEYGFIGLLMLPGQMKKHLPCTATMVDMHKNVNGAYERIHEYGDGAIIMFADENFPAVEDGMPIPIIGVPNPYGNDEIVKLGSKK